MDQQTLNIGTVGTSAIMQQMQEAIRRTPGVTSRVVFSRDAERGKAFAAAMGVQASCCDYEEMLNRSDVDAVYIASPNRFHAGQTLQALRHGKHVIVEKPAALSAADVQSYIQAARQNGVFFFEAITTIHMPNYLCCKALLPQLGTIRRAKICHARYSSKYDAYLRGENPNIFNPEMQAGALNDMGIYCIHVAVDLFGAPSKVSYQAEYGLNGIDLAGKLCLEYPTFICEIETAKNADLQTGCWIEGEQGWIEAPGRLSVFPPFRALINGQEQLIDRQPEGERMVFELSRFRDSIFQRDEAFFIQMASQSAIAAGILEAAHATDGLNR